jgi:probable HAF family extracellular repeat protein
MKTTTQASLSVVQSCRAAAACAVLFCGQAVLGQTAAVTPVTVPGASLVSVTGFNERGHLAGYYFDSSSAQRAFILTNGVAVDLGTLGGTLNVANALNNLDQVVGYSSETGDLEFHGFVWTLGTMLDYGTLGGTISSASAISDASQATGYSYVSPSSLDLHAFLSSGTQLQDLGTLGGSYSFGVAVNNAGQVAGESGTAGDIERHGFLFSGGVLKDLGTLGGSMSFVFGLNNQGLVTGDSLTAGDAEVHAYIHNGTAMADLGTLGGTFSMSFGINDAGQVAGDSTTAGDAENHGFIWSNGAMQDLGTLGGGYSTVWDLNNFGQVVGVSSNALGQERAFVWQNGVMHDLNGFLPANSGWQLTSAIFINDAAQIVGQGLFQGQSGWYRLEFVQTPNQPPVAQAGPDQTVECAGATTPVTLDGSTSSDPEGGALTFAWSEGNVVLGNTAVLSVGLAAGSHTLALRVTDQAGANSEDVVVVNIVDTTPPVVQCPANVILAVGAQCSAIVPNLLASLVASDLCTPAEALVKAQVPAPGTLVGLGTHPVTLSVTDTAGNTSTCTVQLTAADRTVPVITSATANPSVLRPLNHLLVPVTVTVQASDSCDPEPVCRIASVKSNQSITGPDNVRPDWIITGPLTVQLRAESSSKEARVYTLCIVCTDASGNTATCSLTITAQKSKDEEAVVESASASRKHDAPKKKQAVKKPAAQTRK